MRERPLLAVLISGLVTGVLEYGTGRVLLHGFGRRLWDCSTEIWNWGNLHGFVCARSVLLFAAGGAFVVFLLVPPPAGRRGAAGPALLPSCLPALRPVSGRPRPGLFSSGTAAAPARSAASSPVHAPRHRFSALSSARTDEGALFPPPGALRSGLPLEDRTLTFLFQCVIIFPAYYPAGPMIPRPQPVSGFLHHETFLKE